MMGLGFGGAIALLCAVWVIYDVFTHQKKFTDVQKLVWTICAIVFSVFTAIIYYFVVKNK